MTNTLTSHDSTTDRTHEPDWSAIGDRLVSAFPQFPAKEVLMELVNAHEAALYVGTHDIDLADVVEFMATYALRVRAGEISPSGRIAPETRSAAHGLGVDG